MLRENNNHKSQEALVTEWLRPLQISLAQRTSISDLYQNKDNQKAFFKNNLKYIMRLKDKGLLNEDDFNDLITTAISVYIEDEIDQRINNFFTEKFETIFNGFDNDWN